MMETNTMLNHVPNMDYIRELLELLNIPSVTGNTKDAINWLKHEFENFGYDTCTTNKGGLIVTVPGKHAGNGTASFGPCGYSWCHGI